MKTFRFVPHSLLPSILLVWILTFNVGVGSAAAAPFEIFTSEVDQFRVDLPGVPELEEFGEGAEAKQRQWSMFDDNIVRYAINIQAGALQGEQIDRFLALLRLNKIAEQGISADLRADKKLELKGGIKAVEIEMPLKGELRESASVRTRFFVANGKVYILSAAGAFEDVQGESVERFFDSFEILGRSVTPAPPKNSPAPRKSSLRKFTFAKDGFSMNFPSKPKESEVPTKDASGDPLVQNHYASETAAGTYLVSVQASTLSHADDPDAVELAFDSTGPRLAEVFSGEVLEEADIVVGGNIPGREIRVRMSEPVGEYKTHLLFANNRFYQLIAIGTPEFVNGSETLEVFRSFRLLNNDSKSPPSPKLVEYRSELNSFNARVPSRPVYSRRTETDQNGEQKVHHLYTCADDQSHAGTVQIRVTEIRGLCHNSDSQLATMCESLVQEMAGKNRVEQFARVQSDVNPHEWSYRHTTSEPGVKAQGRIVIANDCFFVVQATGDSEFLGTTTTEDVLKSLEVETETSVKSIK